MKRFRLYVFVLFMLMLLTSASAQFVLPTLLADPSSLSPGQTITLSYTYAPANAWVGMLRIGPGEESYEAWSYLGTDPVLRGQTLFAPAFEGAYVFRMFNGDLNGANINNGYIATSDPVTVSGTAIPEFPTVALPVIAVIGLVFLFQRRKGK